MPLPQDPRRRALVIATVCSLFLHVMVLAGFFLAGDLLAPTVYVKRGEPLFVDIAPEQPEEKAPPGNPARPVGPDTESDLARPPEPVAPAPKLAETPKPPAPKAAPKPPAPQVAKAEPAKAEPAPPKPPAPAESVKPAEAPGPAEPAKAEAAPAAKPPEVSDPRYALARPRLDPPASIWRRPGGGGGLERGRGGVEGEPIPLDTPEPRYQEYFNKVRERIKANWVYPREAGERGIEGNLSIEFHIAKDGHLQLIELRRSSGVFVLDQAALNAVKLAQPFPPVPDDIAKQVLAINGLFVYRIRDEHESLVKRFR